MLSAQGRSSSSEVGRQVKTRLRVGVALVGFVGILIVARPGVVTMNVGVAAAALSAVCFAGSIILTKRLTRTETLTCMFLLKSVLIN